jgi:hypothetical protein
MRVYPPLRSEKRGPMSENSLCTTSRSSITDKTWRRWCTEPFLAFVMRRSANGRSIFALASVVVILSCSNNELARFDSIRL